MISVHFRVPPRRSSLLLLLFFLKNDERAELLDYLANPFSILLLPRFLSRPHIFRSSLFLS